MDMSRRDMLGMMAKTGIAGVALGSMPAAEAALPDLVEEGGGKLKQLMAALERAPRRRDFKEVPMILTRQDQWDHEALDLLLHFKGKYKQVWDNTAIDGPWLNLMRNSLNAQVWAFRHPDFLVVSATHGPAHLALYDQYLWDKYQLSKLVGDKYKENVFLKVQDAGHADPKQFEDEAGVFSPHDNNIPVLQARGVVFLACHNAIFEVSSKLHEKGVNPDKLTVSQMVAEFSNHLIPGAVLTPGIVGTLPELGFAGFQYAK